ncbi:uncharacterized protein BDZ83DRAFT_251581 [Colletotrichum acutatum]|uniref:Uncharacterized protein n=1 Tax=Glomerella acutata TaxID=27357 RepID=A0AAD8US39_GLOAC|nr:uncharacterized protein BDZ83DRAFT_251581 [Colletotrichum acutatum]KAK1726713.1 hypothetical protein BDZ83DRAFT_251581 [Colletotrichum acutatum]
MRWGVGYVLSSPPHRSQSNPNVYSRCVLGSYLVRGAGHNLGGGSESELERVVLLVSHVSRRFADSFTTHYTRVTCKIRLCPYGIPIHPQRTHSHQETLRLRQLPSILGNPVFPVNNTREGFTLGSQVPKGPRVPFSSFPAYAPPSAHSVPLWSNRIFSVGSWIIGWSPPPPLCLLKKGSCLRARGSLFARKGLQFPVHQPNGGHVADGPIPVR